jgi:hypothetical protein
MSDSMTQTANEVETEKVETETNEPKPVVLEIRKLDKLETTYVRGCTG